MFRGLAKYMMMLLLCTVVLSCRNDNDCIEPALSSRNVMFTIALDSHKGSRAAWGEDYTSTEATGFESRIMPGELRVAVYTVDGEKLGEVQDLNYWPINEAHTEYRFVGAMPQGFVSHFDSREEGDSYKYKLMVFANCPAGDDANLVYSYTALDVNNGALPMWGVKTVDLLPLKDSDNYEIGTVWLLRAAAKLEVELGDALKENNKVVLDSVYINYFNQTGYCVPENWNTINNTEELDTETFRLFRHAAVHLPFFKDEATGNFYIYVPEYDNINYPEEKAKITIEFTMNGKHRVVRDAISFCEYSGGTAVDESDYNIVRNHLYRYRIRKIAGEQVFLEYSVADWEAEDWGNGAMYEKHDIAYPTYHNPVVPRSYLEFLKKPDYDETTYVIQEKPEMYWENGGEGGAFVCYFKILGPENVEWKPVIMDSKSDYVIKVYNNAGECAYDTSSDDDELKENLGACGTSEWFRIVVFPIDDDGAGKNTVDFGIVYFQGWTDAYINLYVNGEYENIKWPESGNNPKLITISHVNKQV